MGAQVDAKSQVFTGYCLNLSFGGPNKVNSLFYDYSPLSKLSCSHDSSSEMIQEISSGCIIMVIVFIIVLSYVCILLTILKIHSTEGHQNSFSTSTSHLTAVTLFYEIIIFICVMPKSNYSMDQNKMVSMFYTMTPMLKLLIYSLRNKGNKEAMRKCLSLTGSHRYLEF